MIEPDRRRNRRVTLSDNPGIEVEFVLDDQSIRSPVLDLSERGLAVDYPVTAPLLREGQWLGHILLHRPDSNPLQLRVLRIADCQSDSNGRRRLRLIADDDSARAGLWLTTDWLTFGQFGPAPKQEGQRVRVRPVPQRGVYTENARRERLEYLRDQTRLPLTALQETCLKPERLSGNIENLIGSVEIPVGLAGPLLFRGEQTQGVLFAPVATTEGALVASATRGAIAITRAGGVTTRVVRQQMMRVPLFVFSDMRGAYRFSNWVRDHFDALRSQTERVSRHAKLIKAEPELRGNMVTVTFLYETGDAAGQNMSTSCTWHACQWLMQQMKYLDEIRLENFFIESGVSGDKKVSFQSFIAGRGTRVTAECVIPDSVVEDVLKVRPDELVRAFGLATAFGIQSGTIGWNINVANLIAGVFGATGQDMACVHESSVALLYLRTAPGGVYASMVLPSLIVGTVGGGTHLPRQREYLEILGCAGPGKMSRLAEIIAGFCLALDLSTLAAIVGGQFAAAHERLGRNRPVEWFTRKDLVPAFFEAGVRTALDDAEVVVQRVEVSDFKETASSIITELTASKIEKLIGLIPVQLALGPSKPGRPQHVNIIVKVKPVDDEVILMTHRLAAMCGGHLARSHARFKDRLGFRGCHARELAVYEQTDPRFRRHVPAVYRTFRDDDREAFVIALENLSGLELMDSADTPGAWTDEYLDAAVRGIASIHAIWYQRENALRRQAWLGYVQTAADMIEMRDLWRDLSVHASQEFPDWFLPSDLILRNQLIDSLAEWWPQVEAAPRTLIHNDFNPRNLAFRRDTNGPQLVAYDWELATLGVPQHDLAELLCYVLTPQSTSDEVDRWITRHRQALERETGTTISADDWRTGFRLSLFDLALNRFALTIAAHTFRHYGFMERVAATLRHLIALEAGR